MKFVSWNVNGLRACVQKGFLEVFRELDADIFCIQFVFIFFHRSIISRYNRHVNIAYQVFSR